MFLKAERAKFVAVLVLFVALVSGAAFAVPVGWFNDLSFSPSPGSYLVDQTVTLSCGEGYRFQYSLDGTTWIPGSRPSTTIVLDASKTIYARITNLRASGTTGPGKIITGVYTVVDTLPTLKSGKVKDANLGAKTGFIDSPAPSGSPAGTPRLRYAFDASTFQSAIKNNSSVKYAIQETPEGPKVINLIVITPGQ